MISFLNSGILFLTSAITIPVLIYLFARKRPKKIIFSSIRFIKESQQQQKKRINIKNLLLLLIRILIVLSVILAISRPALRLPFLEKSDLHPKTAVAIILDNSYSMNYLVDTQTELEKAKQIATRINEMLSEDDQVLLLTYDNDWNEINSNICFGKLEPAIINNVQLTAQNLDFGELFNAAQQKLKDTHLPNLEIIIISDQQLVEFPANISIPTFCIATSEKAERHNISIQNSSVFNEIVKKGRATKISFELVNHSTEEQQDVIYRLFIDGNTVSEKATSLQAGQQKATEFEIDIETAGWHSGYVEVKNERQTFDNRNYFSFNYKPDANIAFISDQSKIPLVFASLLDIYKGDSGRIELINNADISVQNLQKFDNVIIYNKQFSAKLKFVLENLDSYLLVADKNFDINWQDFVQNQFSITLQQYSHLQNPNPVNYANQYHPITRQLNNTKEIEINDYWFAAAGSAALLKSDKNVLALESEGKCLWLFDVNSLQNPFLLNAAFPVFAYNSLTFMANNESSTSLKIGDKIKTDQITLPDGKSIVTGNHRYFANLPGIYETPQKNIAVNLNYKESSYQRMNDPKQKNLIFAGTEWQQQILHSRYGFELWKYLLVFALILFTLEILLVKKEENK